MNANDTHPPRQPKPPEPVNVRGCFIGGATRQDLIHGAAVLSITDQATDRESAYWCVALYDGGRCTGYRLVKLGAGRQYDLPVDLSNCDCGDRTHRPERPGGCRHMAALRQALPTVAE